MQFREVTWAQQLHLQRLLHGAGAEVTERSLPNYPGAALREIIKQSGHPHNLEPLLLTLRRPANKVTRQRFGEAAGELVLIQKVTSSDPVVTDLKVYAAGEVTDSADGLLHPTKDTTVTFETWLRVEMLDVLRLMIEENLVKSLVPDMQYKLVQDMLQLTADPMQHELIRLYSFCAAYAGLKTFHAARPALVKAGFLQQAVEFLRSVIDKDSLADSSSLALDPFERLKALTTSIEVLYLLALTTQQGDYMLPAAGAGTSSKAAASASITDLQQQRQVNVAALQEHGAAPLLAKAVEQSWQISQDRNNFVYVPPARKSAATNGQTAENGSTAAADNDDDSTNDTEEQKKMRAVAEEAIAAASVTFEENWHNFLKAVYDTELVPSYAAFAVQLGCALLQLLHHEGVPNALPSMIVLQQMTAYSNDQLIATAGSILQSAATGQDATAEAPAVDASTAIMSLPQHQDLELAAFAKLCYACAKPESRDVKLLRCSACGVTYYCSSACQKADWKVGGWSFRREVCMHIYSVMAALAASSVRMQ
eukprot:GHUV01007384.1.p1 GENE.GHUV01007384.1~~GHUV01007384.1.p1  ORF type:complete len:537 (+),score=187.34 GHUV01007384.1:232-1842(+)